MARKPVFDTCMLCDEYPCSCRKKAPKKAVKAVKKAPAPAPVATPVTPAPVDVAPTPKADPLAAMRAAAARSRPPAPPSPEPPPPDPVTEDAIRALAPILHPAERRLHRHLLETPSTVATRAQAWKNRHKEVIK